MLILYTALALAACTPQAAPPAAGLPAEEEPTETALAPAPLASQTTTAPAEVVYAEVALPGDEQIRFLLPQGWEHFGNGQYFSPDGGQTLFDLRLMPLGAEGSIDALMPADKEVLNEEPVLVGDQVQAMLYHLQVFEHDKNAADGRGALKGYEALYTFVDSYGKNMVGMGILTPTETELAALEPVLLNAVESFQMAEPEPPASGYETIREPGPGNVSYELPYQWKRWGNAGLFSPDAGQTLIGLRRVWVAPGQEVEAVLLSQHGTVMDRETVSVAEQELVRYQLEVPELFNGQPGYELVYVMESPDGEELLGFALQAMTEEALEAGVPVVEHMIATFQMSVEE